MGKTASKKSVVKGPVAKASAAPKNGRAVKSAAKPAKAGKPAPAKPAPSKPVTQAKSVPVKVAPAKAIAAKVPSGKTAPVKASPVKAAPAGTAPVKAAPAPATVAKAPAKPAATAKGKLVLPPVKTIVLPVKPPSATQAGAKPAAANGAGAKASGTSAKPGAATATTSAKGKDKSPKIETKPEPYRPMNILEQANSSGDSKPKKNQAGLTAKELEVFRDLLLAKRRELVGDMSSMEREALQSGDAGLSTLPIHMADMGTDNYEQEFTLGLVEKDRTLLREINHALAKIQNGTYGLCEGNGKPITKVRLEAQPWARFSIEYARLQEKGPIRR